VAENKLIKFDLDLKFYDNYLIKLLLIDDVVDVRFDNPEIRSTWLALRDNKFVDWVIV
jgi:hypothetical protein